MSAFLAGSCGSSKGPAAEQWGAYEVRRYSLPDNVGVAGERVEAVLAEEAGCLVIVSDDLGGIHESAVLAIPRQVEIEVSSDGSIVWDSGRIAIGDVASFDGSLAIELEPPCGADTTAVFSTLPESWQG